MDSGSPIPVGGPARGQHSLDVIASIRGCSNSTDKIAFLRRVPYPELLAATNALPGVRVFSVRIVYPFFTAKALPHVQTFSY